MGVARNTANKRGRLPRAAAGTSDTTRSQEGHAAKRTRRAVRSVHVRAKRNARGQQLTPNSPAHDLARLVLAIAVRKRRSDAAKEWI